MSQLPLASLLAMSRVSKTMREIARSRECWYERCRACFGVISPARSAYDWRLVFQQLLHVFATFQHTVVVYGRATLFGARAPLTMQLSTLFDASFVLRMWRQAGRRFRVVMRHKSRGALVELHFVCVWPSAPLVARFCDAQLLPPSSIISPHDLMPAKVETDKLGVVHAADAPLSTRFKSVFLS
jgi:hypothetical protein